MSEPSKQGAEAAAAIVRFHSSPFGRFFDDPDIDAAYLDAVRCARDAHGLFKLIRESRFPVQETWNLTGPLIRSLFGNVKLLQAAIEGECGSDPFRDFAVNGPSVTVGPVHGVSAHAAALKLGQYILDEVWAAAFDLRDGRWIDRPWNSLAYVAPDELDVQPVVEKFAAVVKHFRTLAPWDIDELLLKLEKEAIMTGSARARERRSSTPPPVTPPAPAFNDQRTDRAASKLETPPPSIGTSGGAPTAEDLDAALERQNLANEIQAHENLRKAITDTANALELIAPSDPPRYYAPLAFRSLLREPWTRALLTRQWDDDPTPLLPEETDLPDRAATKKSLATLWNWSKRTLDRLIGPLADSSRAVSKLDEIKRAISCLRGVFTRWNHFYSRYGEPIKALGDYGFRIPPIVIAANGEATCLAQATRLALTTLDGHRVFPPALRGFKLEDAIAKFPEWPTGAISAARDKAFLENLPIELDRLAKIYVELGDLETQLEFAPLSVLERADVRQSAAPAVSQAGPQSLVTAADAVAQPRLAGVPTPAEDDSAYRPAIEFIDSQRFPTLKAIRQALNANPTIRRRRPTGRNGKAIPNRLNIHAGDWHGFIRKQTANPLDLPATVVDAVMETEQRKAEIRKQKDAEK